jgi:hypothetical protein
LTTTVQALRASRETHRLADVQLVAVRLLLRAKVFAVGDVGAIGCAQALVDGVAYGIAHRHMADRAGRQRRDHTARDRVEGRRIAAPFTAQLQQCDVDAAQQRLHLAGLGIGELRRTLFGAQPGLLLQFGLRTLAGLPDEAAAGSGDERQQHRQPHHGLADACARARGLRRHRAGAGGASAEPKMAASLADRSVQGLPRACIGMSVVICCGVGLEGGRPVLPLRPRSSRRLVEQQPKA